jgi:hypothetical protein
LCADGSSPVSQKVEERVEYTKSKFFGGPAAATPSKQAKARSKRSPVQDFTVYSDASMDEALSQLPMPAPTKTVKKKVEVFEDCPLTSAAAEGVEDETQVTTVSAVFSQDQADETVPESPPSQVEDAEEVEEEDESNPFANSLSTEITDLQRKFAFSAATSASFRSTTITKTKVKLKPRKDTSRKPTLPQLDGTCDQAEDQAENHEDQIIPQSDAVEPPSPVSIKRVPESPAVVDSGQCYGGSEDLLVSESEVEGSEPGTPRKSLFATGLGRFAFGA